VETLRDALPDMICVLKAAAEVIIPIGQCGQMTLSSAALTVEVARSGTLHPPCFQVPTLTHLPSAGSRFEAQTKQGEAQSCYLRNNQWRHCLTLVRARPVLPQLANAICSPCRK
jgi:hypothetical protein